MIFQRMVCCCSFPGCHHYDGRVAPRNLFNSIGKSSNPAAVIVVLGTRDIVSVVCQTVETKL